jgi:hypothetical protein
MISSSSMTRMVPLRFIVSALYVLRKPGRHSAGQQADYVPDAPGTS